MIVIISFVDIVDCILDVSFICGVIVLFDGLLIGWVINLFSIYGNMVVVVVVDFSFEE